MQFVLLHKVEIDLLMMENLLLNFFELWVVNDPHS